MKFGKTWIVIILVRVGMFCFGKHNHSYLITFIRLIGIVAGGTCGVSSLIISWSIIEWCITRTSYDPKWRDDYIKAGNKKTKLFIY